MFIAAGFVVNITLRVFVPRLIASTSCVCGNWHGSGRLCAAAGRGIRTTSTRDCDHSRDRGAEIGKVELVASELADPADEPRHVAWFQPMLHAHADSGQRVARSATGFGSARRMFRAPATSRGNTIATTGWRVLSAGTRAAGGGMNGQTPLIACASLSIRRGSLSNRPPPC